MRDLKERGCEDRRQAEDCIHWRSSVLEILKSFVSTVI
jgi:hypothetical protein